MTYPAAFILSNIRDKHGTFHRKNSLFAQKILHLPKGYDMMKNV